MKVGSWTGAAARGTMLFFLDSSREREKQLSQRKWRGKRRGHNELKKPGEDPNRKARSSLLQFLFEPPAQRNIRWKSE